MVMSKVLIGSPFFGQSRIWVNTIVEPLERSNLGDGNLTLPRPSSVTRKLLCVFGKVTDSLVLRLVLGRIISCFTNTSRPKIWKVAPFALNCLPCNTKISIMLDEGQHVILVVAFYQAPQESGRLLGRS